MKVVFSKNQWIFVFFLGFSISACSTSSTLETTNVQLKVLPVTQVIAKDTILHHEYVANIQAVQNVELRARVEGFLENIYVDEGQPVKKGQLLFKLNDEEYKAELAKAEANLSSAIAQFKASELDIDRLKVLVDKKVIAKSELDVAEAKLNAAKAKIAEARSAKSNAAQRLSYASIRAPFDGIIDRIPFKVGSLIEHGTLLTTASDISAVYVYFHVSEGEYLEYVKSRVLNANENNNIVSLVLADGARYSQVGTIETMEGEFRPSTGSIAFRAKFPNPNKFLKHGATGKIRLANRIEGAIMVPQKSVFEIQDKNFVFVVGENNQVRMKNFIPRMRFSDYYIVESGLQPGDKIVYEGIQEVRDGMQIVPKPIGADSLVAL